MRFNTFLALIILLILTDSCKKEYTVVDFNTEATIPYNDSYVGETHCIIESVDSSILTVLKDTIYLDTMLVSYRNDSVFFSLKQSPNSFIVPPGYDNGFKVNSSNSYQLDISPFGSVLTINQSHEFKAPDSLISYSSNLQHISSSGHRESICTFRGKK